MPQEQGSALLSMLGGLFLFVLVLLLAWAVSRWLGRRYGSAGQGTGGHMRVLERMALGPDRSLVIVRVEDRVWLLGVTAHHISPIGELSPDAFAEAETADAGLLLQKVHLPGDFAGTLQEAIRGFAGKKEKRDKDTRDE